MLGGHSFYVDEKNNKDVLKSINILIEYHLFTSIYINLNHKSHAGINLIISHAGH